jgi:hypothetical protein
LLDGLGTAHGRLCAEEETSSVDIRTKHKPSASMHLKSYQIDRRRQRTGAANFAASGLKRPVNDFGVSESIGLAEIKCACDARYASGEARQISVLAR